MHDDDAYRPVADDVFIYHDSALLEDGNAGAAAKGEVSQLVTFLVSLAHLCCEQDTSHLPHVAQ